MVKSKMTPTYTYKIRNNKILGKGEKDMEMIIQDDRSPEKPVKNLFGDTYMC